MSDETRDGTAPETTERVTDAARPAAFTGKAEASQAPLVPKNVQRLATRTLILLFFVALIVFGLQRWQSLRGDIESIGGADTKGAILALKLSEEGSQAVMIKADGAIVESSGYRPGATDRDAVWNPSGDRAFFISDRKEGATHIFRWNPDRNSKAEQKTADESSRGAIEFPVGAVEKADDSALVAVRGNIEEFFPQDSKSQRVLPPTTKDIAVGRSEEGGQQGAFDTLYKSLGYSFRVGEWCRGKSAVAAVMRRNDDKGELLLIQSLVPNDQGALPRPSPIVAGERIEIGVNPATGDIVFSVAGFDFINEEQARQATKDGKIVRPFRNALGFVDLSDLTQPKASIIVANPDDSVAFGAPVVAPDGSRVLVASGPWTEGSLRPLGLLAFPIREQAGQAGTQFKKGEIYEPSWSPDGSKVVYIRRENGRRGIYVANGDGSGEISITGDKGDFAQPLFSPQK